MEKNFDENKSWYVDELSDFYFFKSVSTLNQEEGQEILSWSRNVDLSVHPDKPDRMYDIELDDKKYFFLLYSDGDRWVFTYDNKWEFDELCRKKNINLIGQIK